jgi:hypothetical protein
MLVDSCLRKLITKFTPSSVHSFIISRFQWNKLDLCSIDPIWTVLWNKISLFQPTPQKSWHCHISMPRSEIIDCDCAILRQKRSVLNQNIWQSVNIWKNCVFNLFRHPKYYDACRFWAIYFLEKPFCPFAVFPSLFKKITQTFDSEIMSLPTNTTSDIIERLELCFARSSNIIERLCSHAPGYQKLQSIVLNALSHMPLTPLTPHRSTMLVMGLVDIIADLWYDIFHFTAMKTNDEIRWLMLMVNEWNNFKIRQIKWKGNRSLQVIQKFVVWPAISHINKVSASWMWIGSLF